jgi:SARP family transcriptional regulator, regulator of embCAB operon
MIAFTVLGLLRATRGDQEHIPNAPKVRQVLALSLLSAGQVLSLDAIVEELWSKQPPKSAVITAQTYICKIRRSVVELTGDVGASGLLSTVPSGYQLRIREEQLDLSVFRSLVQRARTRLDAGCAHEAADLLAQAQALWQGPPLANVTAGPVLQPHVVRLEEEQISAHRLRIQADMALGRYRELIGELKLLTIKYPLDEWFHGQLIEALGRVGRRGEALNQYQRLHRSLDTELGIAPSAYVQRLRGQVVGRH